MQLKIQYRNFSYSKLLSQFIADLFLMRSVKDPLIDKQLVEILFFRPTSHRAEDGVISFECHLEAKLPWLERRLSAKCSDINFWTALDRTVLLLLKQINSENQKYCNHVRNQTIWYQQSLMN